MQPYLVGHVQMQGERITLCQPFLFLKILRDESKEFVVINVHQMGFSYFQFLESLKRMSIGEIHPRYFFAFCVCVFISVMELKRSFFFLGISADSISAKPFGEYSKRLGIIPVKEDSADGHHHHG